MKTKTFFTLIMIMYWCQGMAQNDPSALYIPRNIKQAYKNGTRSPDGRPGKNYWQNLGRYDINITAMPPDRTIHGSENITYFNNSPDTLKNLVFKLIVNIHKPGAARVWAVDSTYLTPGIHVDSYSLNNIIQPWQSDLNNNTFQIIKLPQPLIPNDSVQISIQWHNEISLKSFREGMIDPTTYFLAYFYPRIAVYDDYQGWDVTEFDDDKEFYNDFNYYTLNVQVPKNYIVWATGTLLNIPELLQPPYANKLARSMVTDEIIHIVTKEDWISKNVTKQNALNTWKWKANNITDMTFAISDHYNWDASSVVVDAATNRRASVQSAYCDTVADFHSMIAYSRYALDWFSCNWPGIPYPYEKTTVFQGHAGGMEYPMMVNDKTYMDTTTSKWIVEHEIAHTYMPFYMGINETQYGFMDEGWATTFELLIGRDDRGIEAEEKLYKQINIGRWIHSKQGIHDFSADNDLPIITPETNLTTGYEINAYGKPSLAYLALKDLLGDAMFKKCLHEYMNRWHGKHPIPWDFFYAFNDASGQNLNWFWNNWFFSYNYIDLAIRNVGKSTVGYTVTIDNIGGMAIPFNIEIIYTDGSKELNHQTPDVWKNDQKNTVITINTKKSIKSLLLDGGIFMDADESNNTWVSK